MKNIKKIIAMCLAAVLAISCLFLFTACDKTPADDGRRLVETETVYYIDIVESVVKNIPLLFLDSEQSSLTLRTDGTATFRLKLNSGLISLVSSRLDNIGDVDMQTVLNMIYEYLPGLDLTDLHKTLEVFEGGLSIKLLGIDPDDPEMQAMFTHMGETGHLPTHLTIPEEFGLEINSVYYIKDVVSPYTDIKYTGIYMGNHHEDGESFLMFDLTTNEKNEPMVVMDYDLMDIYITAYPD